MQITDTLRECTIDGFIIKLPEGQLERNDYLEVKKALELIGGSWKGGKTQGFVFKEDPSDYLTQLCEGEKINLKKEFQFFSTPPEIADRLVELAFTTPYQIGAILEPSAGQGAIINAIHRFDSNILVNYCELMELNILMLAKIAGPTNFVAPDFLSINQPNHYAIVIGNPPFSKNQDIDHVYKMVECLDEGGRLVSVMSNHWRNTSGKKELAFQKFIEESQAEVHEIEEGAFKESGTGIAACIVVLNKKIGIQAPERKIKSSLPIPKPQKKELPPKPGESIRLFSDSFNSFAYRFGQGEVFIDFLDYVLLAVRWWEPSRDFSYFEKKYSDTYPKFANMLELLAIASDDCGSGFRDALGDLFMELVSGGRNGQFFTPDNICDMMSQMTMPEVRNGENILDPACGSARMLLAAGKRNRHAMLFGCDNDVTCCKMAAINLILNTMQGEIALMDSLKMEYTKSWEVSYRNHEGVNLPVYRVIENKDHSTLWQLHINSFQRHDPVVQENLSTEPIQTLNFPEIIKSLVSEPVVTVTDKKSKQKYQQLQLF